VVLDDIWLNCTNVFLGGNVARNNKLRHKTQGTRYKEGPRLKAYKEAPGLKKMQGTSPKRSDLLGSSFKLEVLAKRSDL